jgi:hypothetical protein
MVGGGEYGGEPFAIVLFDWTLASLDKEMKDYFFSR